MMVPINHIHMMYIIQYIYIFFLCVSIVGCEVSIVDYKTIWRPIANRILKNLNLKSNPLTLFNCKLSVDQNMSEERF